MIYDDVLLVVVAEAMVNCAASTAQARWICSGVAGMSKRKKSVNPASRRALAMARRTAYDRSEKSESQGKGRRKQ
jgi:hypothetical protein